MNTALDEVRPAPAAPPVAAPLNVIISGAGIGGLALAYYLVREGVQCTVYEKAPAIGRDGWSLFLATNGLAIFEDMGLTASLEKRGELMDDVKVYNFAGKKIRHDQLGTLGRMLCIHRSDVVRCLLEACQESPLFSIRFGAKFERFEQDATGVTAYFADGSTARGDALVGADGRHSGVRKALVQEDHTNTFGLNCVYGMTTLPVDDPLYLQLRKTISFLFGPGDGRSCAFSGVGPGEIGWGLMYKAKTHDGSTWAQDQDYTREELTAGLCEPYRSLLMNATTWSPAFPLSDIHVLKNWRNGRVTLLGDAAHPLVPTIGQGANLALEDAYVCAKNLLRGKDRPEDAPKWLQAYEDKRIARTTEMVLKSRKEAERVVKFVSNSNPVLRWMFVQMMTLVLKYYPQKKYDASFDKWKLNV
jgi:2-polyprenyl-6-methoxyphenol hydroxylase-like FAD-dependent oxidoreductase